MRGCTIFATPSGCVSRESGRIKVNKQHSHLVQRYSQFLAVLPRVGSFQYLATLKLNLNYQDEASARKALCVRHFQVNISVASRIR